MGLQTVRRFCSVFALIVLATAALLPPAVQAQETANEKHVAVTLIPETTAVEPGQPLMVAIRQTIAPGWHTYWVNPGDSGAAPQIEWALPEGTQTGPLRFPTPRRIPYGPLTNYGYETEAVMVQDLYLPEKLPDGPFTISAALDLLVCADICIPEYHEVSVTLNDGSAADNTAIINAAFEAMPVDVDWDAVYSVDDSAGEAGTFVLNLHLAVMRLIAEPDRTVRFDVIPFEWGVIDNNAGTGIQVDRSALPNRHVILSKPRGERTIKDIESIRTLILYEVIGGDGEAESAGALDVTARPDPDWLAAEQARLAEAANAEPAPAQSTAQNAVAGTGLFQALLFALLGGLILNLMPCVFPVLSMKALSLAKMTEKSTAAARLHGLAYTAGILVCFGAIAGLLIALQAGGAQIGWGFQLQNPLVILLLAYLLFLIGLNLSGFFEIGGRFMALGGRAAAQDGLPGSFMTGMLAAIVATPCTAPFMGVAMGYALTQPPAVAMAVFLALGFGLALPYLVLAFVPALRAAMPKPGTWMVVFKELLAFPMYGSALWLIWVYSQQVAAETFFYALAGFVGLGFAIWITRYNPAQPAGRWALRGLAAIVMLSLTGFAMAASLAPQPAATTIGAAAHDGAAGWEMFTPDRLGALQNGDEPVFVNMTAAWCITCKVNERIALNTENTKALFAQHNVHYLKGDWTNQDPEITTYLQHYGRNGVPLYVYYGPRDITTGERPAPVILPQLLTPGIVAGIFESSS